MLTRPALIVLVASILACSGASSDTYLRFTTEGESYTVQHVDLLVVDRPDWERKFFGLGPDLTEVGINTPNGSVQWRMSVDRVEDLAGREIDLSDVDDEDLGPVIQFALTEDVAVHPDRESTVVVQIGSVAEGYIEGTIEATRLVWVSMTLEGTRRVDLLASFRARISVAGDPPGGLDG